MHFEALQMISLNGKPDRLNDDRCGASAQLAWVVDGATDMGPPGLLGAQGGAAWLASTASTSFAMIRADCIEATCKAVFAQIEAQYEKQKTRDIAAAWEVPKAAFAAVQIVGDTLEVAWAADCPILKIRGERVDWCTGAPDTSSEAADALALGAGVGALAEISGAVLEDRRAHRGQDDHIALSPNADASADVTRYAQLPIAVGDELLLMSDGFSSLVSDYKTYSGASLAQAIRARGLGELALEIRQIEKDDAACIRYPRFKISDDATALWLRVAG